MGRFDDNCYSACPRNCHQNICDPDDGQCFSCNPGWTGATCMEGIESAGYIYHAQYVRRA